MKIILALTAFIPAGHYSFKPLPFQLCLTSFLTMGQYYFQKRQQLCPRYVFSAWKKGVTVFQTPCKEDFPWASFWGFCCTHTGPHMPRKCLGNVLTSGQYKLRGFSTWSPQPSCQDYPKSTASMSNCRDDGLETHHRVQSCSELAQHSRDWTIMMAESQRCLAALSSHWAPAHWKTWTGENSQEWQVSIHCFDQERPGELWLSPHQSHAHRHRALWPNWVVNHG